MTLNLPNSDLKKKCDGMVIKIVRDTGILSEKETPSSSNKSHTYDLRIAC